MVTPSTRFDGTKVQRLQTLSLLTGDLKFRLRQDCRPVAVGKYRRDRRQRMDFDVSVWPGQPTEGVFEGYPPRCTCQRGRQDPIQTDEIAPSNLFLVRQRWPMRTAITYGS